jgi:hypothetical protein
MMPLSGISTTHVSSVSRVTIPLSAHDANVALDMIGSVMIAGTNGKAHPETVFLVYVFHRVSVPEMLSARMRNVESGLIYSYRPIRSYQFGHIL